MWNPDDYRDMDFGLGEDETFEPDDDLEEEYTPADGDAVIMTVLGPIPADEAGVTLVREHLQWLPRAGAGSPDLRLDDPMAALDDLGAFATVSGRTVVSATPADAGRNARGLLWLAQRAPVHVVGATGVTSGEAADLRAQIVEDLERGMDGTSARPGVFVLGSEEASDGEAAAIETYCDRQAGNGLPVLSMVPAVRQREVLDRLARSGIPAGKVIVCGAGGLSSDDLDAVLASGSWLVFDGIGVDGEEDRAMARRIAALAGEGHAGRILVSHGYQRRSQLTGYSGRPGFPYVVEQFAVMLLEEGLEAMDVRRMLVDNADEALATVHAVSSPPEPHREG